MVLDSTAQVGDTRSVSPSYRDARVVQVLRKKTPATSSQDAEIAAVLSMGFYLLGFRERPRVDRSVVTVIAKSR